MRGNRGAPGGKAPVLRRPPVLAGGAQARPQPVGRDGEIGLERVAGAGCVLDRDARPVRLLPAADDGAAHHQPDRRARPHRVEEQGLELGPVDDVIGRAEALAHEGAERDGADLAPGCKGADRDAGRLARGAAQRRPEAEIDQDPARIRGELDAGAVGRECGAALDEGHLPAAGGERERGGEPADAGAGDDGGARRHLEYDPEKWEPVFGKDHARTNRWSGMMTRREIIPL